MSAGREPPQERATLARQRILLLGMREREKAPDGMGGVERRLAEATVELAAPRARDVRHHRVEDVAPFFVLVEGEIQEMPEEPPALRNAEHVGAIEGPGAGVPLLRRAEAQEGRRVADRHETEPDEGRILRPVQALVELPRLESAGEGDEGRVGHRLALDGAGEAPGRPRHRRGGGIRVLTRRQLGLGIVELGGRIRNVITIRERERGDPSIRPKLAADSPRDAPSPRDSQGHHSVLAWDIVLPPRPGHRVALAHQETVAEVLARGRVVRPGRAVEHAERDLAAAVRHIQEEAAIASAGGAKEIEVRGGLGEPLGIARGQAQIGDGLIGAQ